LSNDFFLPKFVFLTFEVSYYIYNTFWGDYFWKKSFQLKI